MKLSPTAVYTTIAPETVFEAARGDDPSEVLNEKKRWVTALKMFEAAKKQGLAFPILFSDARSCSDLIYWARVEDLKVKDDGTYFTFSGLQGLHDCFTQDLVLTSEKRNIAPGYIRPYAIVGTPDFLEAASMDAEERCDQQIASYHWDVDWERRELVRPVALDLHEDWHYFLDHHGDVARVPLDRRRGQRAEKVLELGVPPEPGFFLDFDDIDGQLGVWRCPLVQDDTAESSTIEILQPASPKPSALTLFAWGYAGWGSSVPQLLEVTEAAERTRGFEPPVFVDVRFSRSVRAPGFRERTFENALPAGRYRWMKGLGNEGITSGGEMKIHKPEEAGALLDLALEERARSRRVIFFCSCESPEFCHRNAVRDLLLEEAKRRRLQLEVAEWPGGEPRDAPACTLQVTPTLMTRILHDAPRIPIDKALAVSVFASHPWGGYVEISDGARKTIASVGPAKYSAGGWFVEPFVGPIEEGDDLVDLTKATRTIRDEGNYRVFKSEGVKPHS